MDSCQITKPFLVVVCYVLFLFLVVATMPPAITFATLDSSSNQSEPEPDAEPDAELQSQLQPQPDRPSYLEDLEERLLGPETTLSLDQSSANIDAGDTARATLTVGLARGNAQQSVSLSCNLTPASSEANCNIRPSEVTLPTGTATLTITTEDTISPGQYTATITATTEQGIKRTTNFVVTVDANVDNPPLINVPTTPFQVSATGPSGAQVPYEASATDDVDGSINPSCTPSSGSTFSIGDTEVTCSATDSSGNTASESFTITVVEAVTNGNTRPVITGPPTTPIEVEATSNTGEEVSYSVTAFDREDGNMIPQCDPPSGSIFRIGETIVKCNIVDKTGNVASKEFPVIVRGISSPNDGIPFPLPFPLELSQQLLLPIILAVVAIVGIGGGIALKKSRGKRKSRTDFKDDDDKRTDFKEDDDVHTRVWDPP